MKSSKLSNFLIDSVEVLIIGLGVFLTVYVFIGQPLQITGSSMEPTLDNGEIILAEKMTKTLDKLKRGDIVVFRQPENPDVFVIKRIIGMPGETIALDNNSIAVNGKTLPNEFLMNNTFSDKKTYEIPNDAYFLMGDNRSNSTDSRKWGPIKKELIVGKAAVVFSPISKARIIQSIQDNNKTSSIEKFENNF